MRFIPFRRIGAPIGFYVTTQPGRHADPFDRTRNSIGRARRPISNKFERWWK
ncbi:hypothetical protein C7S16_6764 [Burkholderia thailandensis]|uniref:Uncharacterized protein n=1 Tax=Burkholderia thailandensis TaxID=57975 RepID=A0AAW9CJA1_BURTH|nr:hypothetical protein [Burkholderia thailandensis]MDW9250695.1 hypothetical protein [Burkholderia thailandensis]